MKSFSKENSKLTALPLPMKLIFGMFLVAVSITLVSATYLGIEKTGYTPSSVATYYRGDLLGSYPKTKIELLEITHFHAIGMGILFLTMAHLLLMTSLKKKVIMSLIIVGSIGLIGSLVSPWLIRYHSGSWASIAIASLLCYIGSIAFMSLCEGLEILKKKKK